MKVHNTIVPAEERESRTKKKRNKKKRRRGKNWRDQYRLAITLVSAWGNGQPYCISPLDSSPWSGEARILLMHLTFQCNQTRQPQRNFSRPRRSTCTDAETISTQQCCCCCCCAALKNKKKLTVFPQIKPTCYLRPRPGGGITETNKYSPLIQARKWNNPLCLKMFCNTAAKKWNNCRKCYVSVSSGSVSGRIQVCNMKVFHGSYNVMHVSCFFFFYYIYSSFAHAVRH